MKDAPLLAAAAHAGADLFVTGDAHDFGPLFGKVFRGVHVVTLARAFGIVLRQAGA